ncbi:MAG: hypothetical protein LBU70_07490 [Chitinispirillales bacterium]|nr:hypothetical protein [Chitinispirillales bacterium]
MGKLRDISGWIIAAALAVVLGVGAVGCAKRVQQVGEEPEQIADIEQIQEAEAEVEQADIYNDEADFEFCVC